MYIHFSWIEIVYLLVCSVFYVFGVGEGFNNLLVCDSFNLYCYNCIFGVTMNHEDSINLKRYSNGYAWIVLLTFLSNCDLMFNGIGGYEKL